MAVAGILVVGCLATIAAVAMPSGGGSGTRPFDPLARGERLLDEGKIEEAQKIFAEELERDPKNSAALKGLSVCARDSGDDEGSLQYLQRLAVVSEKDPWVRRQLALTLHRLGRDQEAMAELQVLIRLVPDDPSASQLMTKLVMSQARTEDPTGRFQDPMTQGRRNAFDPFQGMPRRPEPPDPMKLMPGKKPY